MVPESGNCYWIPFVPAAGTTTETRHPADADSGPSRSCPPPVPGEAAVFKAGNATFVFNSRVNWPEEESFKIRLAGSHASGKLGPNGWVAVLNEDNEQAHLWFFARRGAHLVMEFDQPVFWRTRVDDSFSAISGQTRKASSVTANAWSGPVHHIDISADQRPWDVVVRRSQAKPSD
jgi:hypothetical protein